MNKIILSPLFATLLLVASCTSQIAPELKTNAKKISVVTSFYPLGFFASQIAGDKADVITLTPSGAEPHDYEPTTQDVVHIEKADVLILNGGGLEAWGDKIKQNLQGTHLVIVFAGEGLVTRDVTEEGKKSPDPHIWLDPVLAEQEVRKITQALSQIDDMHKTVFEAHERALDSRLEQLNDEYKTGLANCTKKDIVTSHAAFGYVGQEYGLNQVAISGLSPDEEPSPKQMADTTAFVKKNHVTYIFFESLVSPKLSETIATETGAKTLELNPLEGLTEDEVTQGDDYFTIMKLNLANLQTALECKK